MHVTNSATAEDFKSEISALKIALDLIGRRINPVPVNHKGKKPIAGDGWQHIRITADNAKQYFNGAPQNVGAQLGPASKGPGETCLTDSDADCRETRIIAPYFLPKTNCLFGRDSARSAHRFYYSTLANKHKKACFQFRDVDKNKTMLIELRIGGDNKGAQTVVPGSVHESGELIKYEINGTPAVVPDELLLWAHRVVAALGAIARHLPENGSKARHNTALIVAGFLSRCPGWDEPKIRTAMEAIAAAVGDDEPDDRINCGRDALRNFLNGGHTYGFPALKEAFGAKLANKVAQWLDFKSERAESHVEPPMETALSMEDFYGYMPMQSTFIHVPTRGMWPASSVDARIPPIEHQGHKVRASAWIASNRPVDQMTWAPGLPMLIKDKNFSGGGHWTDGKGQTCFNQYRAPQIKLGDAAQAEPWISHVKKVFGPDAKHIIYWLAQRVQQPGIKINHALVLSGRPGIGKDTLLAPVRYTIGPENFEEQSPQGMLRRFSGHLKSVILRVSEAGDLGEINRFAFNDHLKAIIAAPPETHRIDEKHVREYHIPNVVGVIITTNHLQDGIFLSADDRRHYVAHSDLTMDDFEDGYWDRLWGWYNRGGFEHVAAHLTELSLEHFDPKKPPPETEAFWTIVNAHRSSESGELADILDQLDRPEAVTVTRIRSECFGNSEGFGAWLDDRANKRQISYRFEDCGYIPIRNEHAGDGLWKVHGKRQTIYGRTDLTLQQRLAAAHKLLKEGLR